MILDILEYLHGKIGNLQVFALPLNSNFTQPKVYRRGTENHRNVQFA